MPRSAGDMARFARDARDDAWVVADKRWARVVARSGYVAQALLLLGIGVLALLLALHGPHSQPDSSGAFGDVARVPGGVLLLGAVSVGEYALAVWLVIQGVLHRGRRLEDWRRRIVYWGRAPVYAVVGTIALRFALGAHENGERTEREASRHLLDVPGGSVVLAAIGGVVAIIGLSFVWLGLSRRFRKTIREPERALLRHLVLAVGAVGYVARGVTLTILGVLVVIAAITFDPKKAAGLDSALGGFARDPLGHVALAAIAIGWLAAGVYTIIRAALARFQKQDGKRS